MSDGLAAARALLRAAIAMVASEYSGCAIDVDVNGDPWRAAERAIDAAFTAGDAGRAAAAVDVWVRLALAEMGA